MKKTLQISLALIVLTSGVCAFADDVSAFKAAYPDPQRFEKEISNYTEKDKESPPPKLAVLAYGSSSIRMWHPTISEDLKPLTIIPRGFGGSTMYDALYYAEQMVIPYAPRAVLFYEGDNDASLKIKPETIRDAFRVFVEKLHKSLPETRIYFISIKPSISRWEMWPAMQEANGLIKTLCDANPLLTFIDVGKAMLGEDGKPKPDIFMPDKLHLNAEGYKIWKQVIAPVLLEGELQYEEKDAEK